MKLKTWAELPITVHFDIEPAEPDVGIFSTSAILNEITLVGYDITDTFSDAEKRGFEQDALDHYFDEMREREECRGDYLYEQMKDMRILE